MSTALEALVLVMVLLVQKLQQVLLLIVQSLPSKVTLDIIGV
jgi:hypothetical protein